MHLWLFSYVYLLWMTANFCWYRCLCRQLPDFNLSALMSWKKIRLIYNISSIIFFITVVIYGAFQPLTCAAIVYPAFLNDDPNHTLVTSNSAVASTHKVFYYQRAARWCAPHSQFTQFRGVCQARYNFILQCWVEQSFNKSTKTEIWAQNISYILQL